MTNYKLIPLDWQVEDTKGVKRLDIKRSWIAYVLTGYYSIRERESGRFSVDFTSYHDCHHYAATHYDSIEQAKKNAWTHWIDQLSTIVEEAPV